jgi:hypothetical protein
MKGIQWGPVGGTKQQKARHRSYCVRHGEMTWEEYIAQPGYRGKRRDPEPQKTGLFRKISAWLKMLLLSVG